MAPLYAHVDARSMLKMIRAPFLDDSHQNSSMQGMHTK